MPSQSLKYGDDTKLFKSILCLKKPSVLKAMQFSCRFAQSINTGTDAYL